jgi:hypothetical protein
MIDEFERIWKEAVWYYPGDFLKGLKKTMKIHSQNSWCPG